MYSVVVLMALSTSAEAPEFGRRGGCGGCGGYSSGCHGYSYGGCGGYSSGCHGYSYGGCGGRHSGGCHGQHHSCHGSAVHYHSGCCGGTVTRGMPRADAGTPGYAAEIAVTLPAAGQIVIDDYTVPTVSNRHVYVTAPLGADETRQVTFRAEVMRDGKRQTVTKQIAVKAGQRTEVALGGP
jgi:uncharacterized protein (TIGR03000 family)